MRLILSALLLTLTLAGCTPPTTPAPDGGTGTVSVPASAEAAELLRLTNATRAEGATCNGKRLPPAPPVTYHATLERAAALHAADMARAGYFSHTGQDGSAPGDRLTRAGYTWMVAGENIARGQTSPAEVHAAWLASTAGHCEMIVDPSVRELGIGIARSAQGVTYWVENYARAR